MGITGSCNLVSMDPAAATGTPAACALCAALARAGVTTVMQEVCPPEAASLEDVGRFKPGAELQRCRECGAFYRYRHHYEYNALGPSWDEYYLWRLEEPAQVALRALLAAPLSLRDAALAAMLRHDCDHAREAAAIVAWMWLEQGQRLDASVTAACQLLRDRVYYAAMFAYHALLDHIRVGREPAARVRAALEATGTADEKRFAGILVRACRELGC